MNHRSVNISNSSFAGNIIQGDSHGDIKTQISQDLSQDLTRMAEQIQSSIDHLQQQGKSPEEAQEAVAKDIATQAQKDPTAKEKLIKWGELIGTATVTDVVKGAVKLAIRLAGIPMP